MRFRWWMGLSIVLCRGGYAAGQAGSFAGAPAVVAPSGLVQPSLATVQQSLERVLLDRWKTSKALKDTTTNNLASIHRDLETTLPGLLATADGVPGSAAGLVPVSQNLGALYDVLLRVTVVAESSAPTEQTAALEQALTSLESARQSFTERLQSAAETQDRRLTELQATLNARPESAAGPVPCKPTPATKVKKKPVGSSHN